MKFTRTDKIIAYLTLLSGLSVSAVAEYYSVMGLMAIFAAAVIPIIVMGVSLGVSKLVATVWLKMNWNRAPFLIKTYLLVAIVILMTITSMGIFGFLSKAHSDQSLVSGDVQAKISVYDEKIKTSKDNIDANRKALKQMDDAVDQVMGRSTSETGADKAVGIRRSQQKERSRLQSEIASEQKTISKLSEERAPIAAEVRKVEAEVGPIKYIAALIYGDNPDANLLDRAVTWVIIIIVAVFDPLAVILLLASQYSFQYFRAEDEEPEPTIPVTTDKVEEPLDLPEQVIDEVVAEFNEPSESVTLDMPGTTGGAKFVFLDNSEPFVPPAIETPANSGPLIKALEGKEAYELMKNIGIFTKDGKLAYEYGGEEEFEDEPMTESEVEHLENVVSAFKDDGVNEEEFLERFDENLDNGHKVESPILTVGIDEIERPGDYVTQPEEFAPPGTPGEVWTAPHDSEQHLEDKLDKIYKASTEELVKQKRSRGWFQATFPKKDNI
jgi:hypothetical protein